MITLSLAGCSLPSVGLEAQNLFEDKAARERALKIADISANSGNYLAAIDIYQKILAKNQFDQPVLYELGSTYLKAGSAEEAVAIFENLGAQAPENIKSYIGLGRAQLFLYRPETAALYYGKALMFDEKSADALSGLAIAEDMSGEHVKARKLYMAALEIMPDNIGIRNNHALSYLMEENYEAAINSLSLLAFDPRSTPHVRQNLAMAYGLAGDEASALKISRLDLDPQTAENNLKFYSLIRRMKDRDLLRRFLLGPRVGGSDTL